MKKMDLLRNHYADQHECDIEVYYERSNGLGDWWANQEGAVEYFHELVTSGKNLSEYPKDFQIWFRNYKKFHKVMN